MRTRACVFPVEDSCDLSLQCAHISYSMKLYLPLLTLVLIGEPALSAQQSVRWNGPSKPVYVVTRNRYAGGFTPEGPTARLGDLLMIEIWNPERQKAAKYKNGERLSLFAGAQRVGTVTPTRVTPLQCDSSAALVSADTGLRFSPSTFALATNAPEVRSHQSTRREPTVLERDRAFRMATSEFRRRGFAAAVATSAKIEHLDITDVDGRGKGLMVGSAASTTKNARHQLFFIAGGYEPHHTIELSSYHRATDLDDGKDSRNLVFADQLDLDGDGTDELIVEMQGYENEAFWIYHRRNGLWVQVWTGGQGSC